MTQELFLFIVGIMALCIGVIWCRNANHRSADIEVVIAALLALTGAAVLICLAMDFGHELYIRLPSAWSHK